MFFLSFFFRVRTPSHGGLRYIFLIRPRAGPATICAPVGCTCDENINIVIKNNDTRLQDTAKVLINILASIVPVQYLEFTFDIKNMRCLPLLFGSDQPPVFCKTSKRGKKTAKPPEMLSSPMLELGTNNSNTRRNLPGASFSALRTPLRYSLAGTRTTCSEPKPHCRASQLMRKCLSSCVQGSDSRQY